MFLRFSSLFDTIFFFAFVSLTTAEVPFVELKPIELIETIVFSPDGKRIVSTANDGNTIRVWDAESGKELENFDKDFLADLSQDEEYAEFAAISPDGKKIALKTYMDGDQNNLGIVHMFDIQTRKKLQKLTANPKSAGKEGECCVYDVIFATDGKRILTTYCGGSARIWDAESGKELQHIGSGDFVAFSPDGKKVVTGGGWGKTIQIWNADSGKEVPVEWEQTQDAQFKFSFLCSAEFSLDGKKVIAVVSVGENEDSIQRDTVRIFDADSGKELRKLQEQELSGAARLFWSAALSPDGKKAVTAGFDGIVRVWDIDSGKELQKFMGVPHLPNGTKGIAMTSGGHAAIWVVDNGTVIWGEEGGFAAFSPDGNKIIVANDKENSIQIFDAETGKESQQWKGKILAFSPDRKKFIMAVNDNTIRVWTLP